MVRPSKSVEWPRNSDIGVIVADTDTVEYCTVDDRGYPTLYRRPYAYKSATVIVGNLYPEPNKMTYIDQSIKVFTCYFSGIGHLSSIGSQYAGTTLTVIVHDI